MVTENSMDFKDYEQRCFDMGMEVARNRMAEALKQLDEALMESRDRRQYRHKGLRPLTIKTLMGEVTVDRVMYRYPTETGDEASIYLLDEALGLDTIGQISIGLILRMAEEITEKSFRGTARGIGAMTGQRISHQGVWNVIQALGGQISQMDENRAEAAKNYVYQGEKSVPVLMEEYDGIWINMQGPDRPKKKGKAEMKVSVTYEGTEVTGRDKKGEPTYSRIHPLYMVGFEKSHKFFEKKEGQLASVYNLDEVTDRLINGDGGDWIKACEEKTGGNTHFQLDPFHIRKAITESGLASGQKQAIHQLLKNHQVEQALTRIKDLADTEGDKKKKESILKLYQYLYHQREGLIPIRERNIVALQELENIPKMGTAETTVCGVVALRMKKRRASFTKEGATNLGRLLSLKRSNLLAETVSRGSSMLVPIAFEEYITAELTAAKSPKRDGHGFHYPQKGGLPFEGQSTTNGRKAIRSLTADRNGSDLVYR